MKAVHADDGTGEIYHKLLYGQDAHLLQYGHCDDESCKTNKKQLVKRNVHQLFVYVQSLKSAVLPTQTHHWRLAAVGWP